MFNPKSTNKIGYTESRNGNDVPRRPAPATSLIEEGEALLLLLETSVHELNQPMAVVLGLSENLLSQSEQETSLAKDLEIIVKELRHAHEVLRGLNLLTQYETNSLPH